jgi:hypothetical protein
MFSHTRKTVVNLHMDTATDRQTDRQASRIQVVSTSLCTVKMHKSATARAYVMHAHVMHAHASVQIKRCV